MEWVWMILIGFVAGLIARALKPGSDKMGFILTTIVGILGSFIGAFLGRALGLYRADEPAGFLGAVVGAIILLTLLQLFRRRSLA